MQIKINLLAPDEPVEDYALAMSRAFIDYPVMKRAFAAHPGDEGRWIAHMVSWSERVRQVSGGITPVARFGHRIVGGVNVILPGDLAAPPHENWFAEFLEEAGPQAQDFFSRFLATVDSIPLPNPHVLLGMLGVDPEFQGKGIGRQLVERVIDIARDTPGCKGIALDTEGQATVRLYEACGFSVVGQTSVDDVPIWVMWRDIGAV
jgi:GNAT superfamily N-acetyltransferase